MRIRAYSQLLESYRSLTLESLSTAFGVSTDFIDAELARFIALRGLKCTIDKVNGVVETDTYGREGKTGRAAQYEVVVRQQGALAPIMKSVFPDCQKYGLSVSV